MKKWMKIITMALVVSFTIATIGVVGNAAAKKVTVTYWNHPFWDDQQIWLEGLADEFMQENPGINVEINTMPWDRRRAKVATAIAAGNPPDVWYMTWDFYLKLMEADSAVCLDSYLTDEVRNRYTEATWEEVRWKDGKLYILPYDQEVSCMLYNRDMFDAAGIKDAPDTWDEFVEDMQKLTIDKDGDGKIDQYGFHYNVTTASIYWVWSPFLWSAGGDLFNEDHTYVRFNDEFGVETLQWISDLFNKYKVVPDDSRAGVELLFEQQGVAATGMAGTGWPIRMRPEYPTLNIFIGPPLKNRERFGCADSDHLVVFKSTKDREAAAVKWIFFLTREGNAKRWGELSGMVPQAKNVKADFGYDDVNEAAVKYFEFGHLPILDPLTRDLNGVLMPAIQEAVAQVKTPKQALDYAAEIANDWLAPRR